MTLTHLDENNVSEIQIYLAFVKQIKSFERDVRQQIFCLSKSRLFHCIDNAYFIRVFEKEVVDCDVLVDDELMIDTLIDKLFKLRRFRNVNVDLEIVTLKIKNINSRVDNKENIAWDFSFSQDQLDICQTIIIIIIQALDFVAFLSMNYVRRRKNMRHETNFEDYSRSTWTLHFISKFSFELTSFMIFIAQLKTTLESMRDYIKEIAIKWYVRNQCFHREFEIERTRCKINEHIEVKYDVSRSMICEFEILESILLFWRNTLDMIAEMHETFKRFFEYFSVEILTLFSLFEDFKFVQIFIDIKVIVKNKNQQCKFALYEENRYMRRHQYVVEFEESFIYSWKTQWNFLYIRNIINKRQTFFLSRDMISLTWWNVTSIISNKILKWSSNEIDILKNYIVDLIFNFQLIVDFEKILNMTKLHRLSMKAQDFVSSTSHEFESWNETFIHKDDDKLSNDMKKIKSSLDLRWKRWSSSHY